MLKDRSKSIAFFISLIHHFLSFFFSFSFSHRLFWAQAFIIPSSLPWLERFSPDFAKSVRICFVLLSVSSSRACKAQICCKSLHFLFIRKLNFLVFSIATCYSG
ncbi:hypothetical protein VNO78_25361 [Psophocarpus tetragonolobus]|uniref:Uncharacterized protein n=1 Tax=Psophocarpus tetragonolobus TaxID=3891 RepID=A0AAN9S9Z5_PSOTE